MTFVRATSRQIQTIKNLCFSRSNIYYVYATLERLGKQSLFQLSVSDAHDLIATLLTKEA